MKNQSILIDAMIEIIADPNACFTSKSIARTALSSLDREFLVMGPNAWGRGTTEADAMRGMRRNLSTMDQTKRVSLRGLRCACRRRCERHGEHLLQQKCQ